MTCERRAYLRQMNIKNLCDAHLEELLEANREEQEK